MSESRSFVAHTNYPIPGIDVPLSTTDTVDPFTGETIALAQTIVGGDRR